MKLSAIGIASKDINSSIQFYNHFGLSFKKVGEHHYEALSKSGLRIMLDSHELLKKLNPSWSPSTSSAITLCFEMESINKLEKVFKLIQSEGHQVVSKPYDAFWGQRYASILDPDNNQIDLYADL